MVGSEPTGARGSGAASGTNASSHPVPRPGSTHGEVVTLCAGRLGGLRPLRRGPLVPNQLHALLILRSHREVDQVLHLVKGRMGGPLAFFLRHTHGNSVFLQ